MPVTSQDSPSPAAPGPAQGGFTYATFLRRLSGYLIDFSLFIPAYAVVLVWVAVRMQGPLEEYASSPMGAEDLEKYLEAALSLVVPLALMSVALSTLFASYYVIALTLWGRTLGGRIVGIRCLSATGERVSAKQALVRQSVWWAFSLASALIPTLGSAVALLNPLWMLWDNRSQALMDKAAGTIVVREPSLPTQQ